MGSGIVRKEEDPLETSIQDATESAKSGAMIIRRSLIDRIATLLGATFPYVVCATIVALMWNGRPGAPVAASPASTDTYLFAPIRPAMEDARAKNNQPPRGDDPDESPDALSGPAKSIEDKINEIRKSLGQTDQRLDAVETAVKDSATAVDKRWQTLDDRWKDIQRELDSLKKLPDQFRDFAKTVNEETWQGREKRLADSVGARVKMSVDSENLKSELAVDFANLLTDKVSHRLDDLSRRVAANESAVQGLREQFQRAARHEHVAVIFHHNMSLNSAWYLSELNAALQLGRLTTFPHYQLRVYRGMNDAVQLEWPQPQVSEIAVPREQNLEKPATMEIQQRVFATFQDPAGDRSELAPRRRCVLIVSPKCPPIVPNIPASAAWQGVQTSVLVLEGRLPNTPEIDANEYRSILNGWQQFCQWNQGQAIWFNLEIEEKRMNNPSAGNAAPKNPIPPPMPVPANGQKASPRYAGPGVADSPNAPHTKGPSSGSRQPLTGTGASPNTPPAGGRSAATSSPLTPECAKALRETLFRLMAPSFPVE